MNKITSVPGLAGIEKQAVGELVEGLKKLYGDNLSHVILYGSKARGDSDTESDIDILVVLKKMSSSFKEIERIGEIRAPICLKYNLVISVNPIKEEEIDASYKTIFIHNVLQEGVVI